MSSRLDVRTALAKVAVAGRGGVLGLVTPWMNRRRGGPVLWAAGVLFFSAGTWTSRGAVPRAQPRPEHVEFRGAARVFGGDTVVVWGPNQYNGSSGQGQTYVVSFTATVTPGRLYTLHLLNGAADGTHRASKVTILLNGFQIVAPTEVTQQVAQLDRVIALAATDTMRITVAGSGSPFITLSVLSTPSPELPVFGPKQYAIPSGSSKTYDTTFTVLSTSATPYRVYAYNGASNGTQRVTSASVTLNGSTVVSTSELTSSVGSLTKPVTVMASNTLHVVLNGGANSFITLSFTATDTTPPVLTITTPAPGVAVNTTSIGFTGTIQDQSATTVTVNGTAATVTNNTSYAATVPLPTEGSNLLTVTATDATGRHTDSTRTVIRDTQTPALTVSAPADHSGTRNTSVTVTGTVTDATAVTVRVNGTPMTVIGINFSGSVALAYGANVLTTTATDAAGNITTDLRTVTRDTLPPVLTVSAPTGGSTVSTDSVSVTGTVSDDASSVTVAANGVSLPVSGGAFNRKIALSPGVNTILVVATDVAANRTTVSRAVFRDGVIPPDPSTVAPPIDPSVATTMISAVSFLFTGANPIQTGVAPGTIDATKVAVLKGKVLGRDSLPISGAAISIVGHPEYGGTFSRADGAYDLAVNGGQPLAVSIVKGGFLPVQRQATPGIQAFLTVADAMLTPQDGAVAQVDFSAPVQVAQGSVQTDTFGSRQATLLFKQGTQASMTLADGTVQPLPSVSIRATEYTVGANGPAAMPGTLPPNSGYTYAVDLSVDEAVAAGAKDVTFTAPVPFYVDNFLGFAVGVKVPTGYYDQEKGQWIPSADGRVIKIVGVTGSRADVDITGDGVADDSTTLAGIGIDNAERDRLATLYAVGKSLWRVQVTHFTPWDLNWPFRFPADAVASLLRLLSGLDPTRNPCPDRGSIIECETQTLGEELWIAGTSFTLAYRSDRQAGRTANRTMRIPVTGPSVPASLQQIYLGVYVAGQRFEISLPPTANQTYVYAWNGLDAYGRPVQGTQKARVRVGYAYQAVYSTPTQFAENFAQYAGTQVTTIWSRQQIISWQERTFPLGGLDAAGFGLGGWTLSAHHFYDPTQGILYLGTGERRDAQAISATITTVAGSPQQPGFSGDGGPATLAKLNTPAGIALGPDGSLYFGDYNNLRIRRISPSGIITTVAGNGGACCTGDGGPATQAAIGNPGRLRVAPDGSIFFGPQGTVGTSGLARVRRITPGGIISTVAGTGANGFSGDGGPATSAQLSLGRAVLPTSDGGFYFADWDNNRVRRVNALGIISTTAGTGAAGSAGDGGAAISAQLNHPEALTFSFDGSLYVLDGGSGSRVGQKRIRRIGLDGIIRTVWGTTSNGGGGDGGLATSAQITNNAGGIDFSPDAALYLGDVDVCRVRRMGTNGIVSTIAGSICGFFGDGGPATQAQLSAPFDVAAAPDGSIYVADLTNHVIRRISPAFPGFTASDVAVASEDGTELYQFDASGRHLKTRDARTGATLLTFGYDAAGKLVTITDADNNVTTVQRDAQERPTGILAPFGQQTTLTVNGAGYLASLADPAGNVVKPFHSSGATAGLLDSLADARGYVHRFTYDSIGRLIRDDDPAGGFKTLTPTESDTGISVAITTALNHTTTHRLDRLPDGSTLRRISDPAGFITTGKDSTDGTSRTTTPDGTIVTAKKSADPRWGMSAPVVTSFTMKLPSGLTATVTGGRRATLTTPGDPFSLTALTDSTVVNGQLFRTAYDQTTRRFTATSAEGRQSFTTVDGVGRVTVLRTPGLDSTVYGYDNRHRLSQVQTGGRITTYSYDSRGRLLSTTDPSGFQDSLFYDTADRLTRHVLPGGREVLFAYDSSGNLTGFTPPSRPQHGFGFTSVDLAASYTPPNVGLATPQTTLTYNLDRQLTRITRPDTSTIDFAYDNAGRPQLVTLARGTIAFGYSSSTGQLTSVTTSGGTTQSFTYDGSLLKSAGWGSLGTVAVTYNSDLRVATQTVQASQVSFAYDHDGLLTMAGALGLKLNPQTGFVDRDSVQNALNAWSYDPKGDLAGYTASVSGTTFFQTSYTRDSLSRITQLVETIRGATSTVTSTAEFTYDSAGRLATVTRDGQLAASYQYDLNGNRLQLTTPGGAITGSYDAQDRLTQYGSTNYGYTSAGDLRFKAVGSDTTWYTYDELGNLVTVRLPNGTQLDYVIDGQNRRVGKKINGSFVQGFLYQDQLAPVAELNSSAQVVSRFVYATRANVPDYMVKGGATYRLILDHLGSVRLVVNATDGTIAQRIDYDEFGQVTQNTNPGFQPFGFAGGLLDQHTGLSHFGARDFDSYPGRWTAKDPLGFAAGDANVYSYVGNDPINLSDPSGLLCSPFLRDLMQVWQGMKLAWNDYQAWGARNRARGPQWLNQLIDGIVLGAMYSPELGGGGLVRGGIGPVLKGQAGVARAIEEFEAAGGTVLGREITVETYSGMRTRFDFVGTTAEGRLVFGESKYGASAALNANQLQSFQEFVSQGGIPRGANAQAAGFAPGLPIPPIGIWIYHF